MYGKCGDLNIVRLIFEGMFERNGVCWNLMIFGFVVYGKFKEVVEFFYEMEDVGVNLDEIFFFFVFLVCVYGGFV